MTRQATAQQFPRSRPGRRSHLLLAILSIPLLVGLFAAPATNAPTAVQADELADAQAQQRALQRKIADQKQLIAQLNSSQANLAGAIAQTRDQLMGITDDLAATQRARLEPDRRHRRRQGHLPVAGQPARRPRPPGPADRGPGEREEGGARRPEGAARRPRPRGVRGGADVDARDVPVRGQLHGHARRDELPARRGRPGQGPRGPGLRGPRHAAEPPRDGRRGPRGDEHDPPGDGGPEAEARPAPQGAEGGAGAPEGAGAPGRGRAPRRARPVRADGRRREADAPDARGDGGGEAAASSTRSTGWSRGSTTRATSRRSTTGRCAGRWAAS